MKKLFTILLLIYNITLGATTYYVSSSDGSDSDSGLTEALAKATLSWVNSTTFLAGDSILFKRGDTFRGGISQTENGTNSNWIYYGAYGTGDKPKILGAKDLSATGDWTNHATNVWKTTATLGTLQDDISNMIFNNEAFCGYKKKLIDSLNAAHKFFYNRTDDLLYMYCTSNPGSFYTHIEAAGNYDVSQGTLYWINSSYIKIENLDVRYSSAAGIESRAGNCFTIENCKVSYIGGEYVEVTGTNLVRLGNGYSFVQNNDSIIVRYCTANQCYDAGISPQAWSISSMTNMWFYSNIISNCWYSYEFWSTTGYILTNVHFYNNSCYNAGGGFSNSSLQRPDRNNASHVITWALTGTATDVTIRNNIFSESTNFIYRLDDNVNKLTVDYNIVYGDTIGYTAESTKYTTLAAWQVAMTQDANSIDEDPLFISATDLHIQSGSPAIDAGTDLGLLTDYSGHSKYGTAYDIGAYEWGKWWIMNGINLVLNNGNTVYIIQ